MSLSNSGNEKKVRVDICDQLIDGRYLNAVDSSFLEFVLQDVQNFYDKCIQTSILVFPPFNNYRRFLIHKLIEDHFDSLSTFSIGHSTGRRTVVCWKDQLLSKESISEPSSINIASSMGVQKQSDSKEDQEPKVTIVGSERKKTKGLPDVAIYRPPALRKSDEGPSPSGAIERKPRASKQRRPDIAVYVPRALRGVKPAATPRLCTASGVIDKPSIDSPCGGNVEDNGTTSSSGRANVAKRNGRGSVRTLSQSSDSTPESSSKIEEAAAQFVQSSSMDSSLDNEMHESFRESRISISSHAETRENSEEVTAVDDSSKKPAENIELRKAAIERKDERLSVESEVNVCNINESESVAKMECVDSEKIGEKRAVDGPVVKLSRVEVNGSLVEGKCSEVPSQCEDSEMVPCESDLEMPGKSESVEVPVSQDKEVLAVTKRRKSDGITKGDEDSEEKNNKTSSIGQNKPKNKLEKLPAGRTGESHSNNVGVPLSSWEDLFEIPAESIEVIKAGESKTRKLIDEVASAVGRVNFVEKPRCNYTQYRTDNANFLSELSHVVEIYGFPAEFKTPDLISVLSPFGGGNSAAPAFEIRWVDDTHALAVFASSFVAADVLNLNHPLVKTRALDESSAVSKAKARKTCESLRIPFRPRPETCPAMAQRLITGALGVNRRQSKEEREEERRLLREAREKRRNAARERDAAWEGTIASAL